MAESDKIKHSDLIEKDVFKPTIDEAKELITVLDGITEGMKTLYEQSTKAAKKKSAVLGDPKAIKEASKAVAEAEKARIQYFKAEEAALKVKLKLEAEVRRQESEANKKTKAERIEMTAQQKAQAAVNAKIAKQEQDQMNAMAILNDERLGAEAKLLAQAALLRIERAKLKETDENYQSELERINKLLDENTAKQKQNGDQLTKQRLNVGNYTESVREAIDSSELLGDSFANMGRESKIAVTGLNKIYGALIKTRDQFKESQNVGGKFKSVLGGVAAIGATALAAGFGAALATSREMQVKAEIFMRTLQEGFGLFVSAVGNLFENKLLPNFELFFLKIEKKWLKLTSVAGSNKDEINAISAEMDKLNQKTGEYKDLFSEMPEKLKQTANDVEEIVKIQQKLIDKTQVYSLQIAELNGEAEMQAEIAGDSTRSYNELNNANIAGLKLTEARIALELKLAKLQQNAAVKEVQLALRKQGIDKQVSVEQIKDLSFINKLKEKDKISTDLQQKIADASVAVTEKRNQLLIAQAKTERELRQIKQDAFEDERDIINDAYDALKTANEKKIADETKTFEARKAILEETKNLGDKALVDSQKAFEEQTGKRINLQELVDEKDSLALQKKIRGMGLSHVIELALLTTIKDRRAAVQDLADAEMELAKLEREKNERIRQSKAAIEILREETELLRIEREKSKEEAKQGAADLFRKKRLIELTKEQEEAERNRLDIQLKLDTAEANKIVEADERAQKLREIHAKYHADVTKMEEDAALERERINKQAFDSAVDYATKTTNAVLSEFGNEIDRRQELAQTANQIEQNRIQRNIEQQRALAERGRDNNLAAEEARIQKAEQARLEAEKKAQKEREIIQWTEAYVNALNARLKQPGINPNLAPLEALKDVMLGKAIGKTLVQFAADGNDDVQGPGTTTSDSIPFMLSKHEGVVKASANMENRGVVSSLNDDTFKQKYIPIEEAQNIGGTSYDLISLNALARQNGKIVSLLEDIKEKPVQMVHVDSFGNLIETLHEQGMKKVITHKRRAL